MGPHPGAHVSVASPHLPDLVLRGVALAAWTLAAIALVGLVGALGRGGDDGSALRTAARVAWVLVLVQGGRFAWRWPRGRAARARRRVLRLVAVIAAPTERRAYAESTPSTRLGESLCADWEHARRPGARAAFTAEETRRLRVLDDLVPNLARVETLDGDEWAAASGPASDFLRLVAGRARGDGTD